MTLEYDLPVEEPLNREAEISKPVFLSEDGYSTNQCSQVACHKFSN